MQLFEKIRQDNISKYGTEVSRYIPIIVNQYSDRTHFIYEILQNAEDAEATYVKFHLYKTYLEIYHNGRPFDEKDINGVCGIANGTKDDGTRIGHFGIGFKAIYGYTSTPKIYSGEYCFEITNYLNPYEIEKKRGLPAEETCIVLPFDQKKAPAEVAYKEIRQALINRINAESILMLSSIVDIEIKVDGLPNLISINKEKGPLDSKQKVFALNILTINCNQDTEKNEEKEDNFLLFTDAGKEASAIIFKVNGKELEEVRNSKIYAFFPTAKEAHQNFYIHAPFDTTPARDNFKEGEDFGRHNIKLIDNICKVINFAFIWLRDNGYLSLSSINRVFPIYQYDEKDLLYAIYQNSINFIKSGEPILPTNVKGVYKSIHEICIPENMGIANVFQDFDLQRLLGNRKIFWLSKEITTNAYSGVKAFLDRNFKFQTFEWRHLVLKMDAAFLEKKDIHWMEQLLGNIESFCIRRGEQQSRFLDVSNIPFVRLVNGKHICAYKNGKPQVYLNNPSVSKYKIAEDFRKNEIILSFYERALKLHKYDLEQEITDNILPKYETNQVSFKTNNPIRENIEDLKQIKDAIYVNSQILNQLADKYIVTDGRNWYKPSELYIQSDDGRLGYGLVHNIVEIKVLAPSYFDDTVMSIKLDEEFFKKIGCLLGIRSEQVSKEEYLKTVRKYCGNSDAEELREKVLSKRYISKRWDWQFNYEGFPTVFQNMTLEKSYAIARFLNANYTKFEIQGQLVGADDQNFVGKNVDSVNAYSMLGLQLCFEKWVYVKNNAKPQRPIDVERDELLDKYHPVKRFMLLLPFKETKTALYEYLASVYENKGDIEIVRRMLENPDDVLKIAKEKAKSEARAAGSNEKRGSLREQLEKNDREQRERKNTNKELEIAPISEKAFLKREQRLEEELRDSLDQNIKATRGVHFTRTECNKEERLFLSEEYDGFCQICGKKIIKWDGSSYFEAINVLKPSTLYNHLTNHLGLGWNSLSLCPNCAVEYNYCSKKVSSIYDQVMVTEIEFGSEVPIEIEVEIPEGEQRRIQYSPRHFLALKKAFEIFTKEE